MWFAVMLVEYSEKYPRNLEGISGGIPNPASMSYEQIAGWIFDEDIGWEIFLLPINASSDPLQEFYENRLKDFPTAEQERIKQNAARAAKWALGDS
jgi:hypothetical protein